MDPALGVLITIEVSSGRTYQIIDNEFSQVVEFLSKVSWKTAEYWVISTFLVLDYK